MCRSGLCLPVTRRCGWVESCGPWFVASCCSISTVSHLQYKIAALDAEKSADHQRLSFDNSVVRKESCARPQTYPMPKSWMHLGRMSASFKIEKISPPILAVC